MKVLLVESLQISSPAFFLFFFLPCSVPAHLTQTSHRPLFNCPAEFIIVTETTEAVVFFFFLGSKSDMGYIRGAIRSNSMPVQPLHTEETCSCLL